MEACFGVVIGELNCDFCDFGSVRAGDISILTATVNSEGTIVTELKLKPLTSMTSDEQAYWTAVWGIRIP